MTRPEPTEHPRPPPAKKCWTRTCRMPLAVGPRRPAFRDGLRTGLCQEARPRLKYFSRKISDEAQEGRIFQNAGERGRGARDSRSRRARARAATQLAWQPRGR